MERDKKERLTAQQIEEEEMKRELTGIGIYEPGITYQQMKKLIGFINDSKEVNNASDKNTQKKNTQHFQNECLSEVTSETDTMQEQVAAQEHAKTSPISLPKPSCSYKSSRTSPTMHERKNTRDSSSPEFSIFDVQTSPDRRDNSENDDTSEKQHESASGAHSMNRFISLRSQKYQSATENNATRTMQENAAQSEHNQKLDRWRLNPLDVQLNENDVPLQQPSRLPVRERSPFRCYNEMRTSEQRDQTMQALDQHLRKMADLWYNWHRPANSIFQWGSPIQVGTANSSLDREPLTDPKTEPYEADARKDSYERASKRKASVLIANLNEKNSNDDEDDQYDFARVKKKRTQFADKSNNVDRTNQHVRVTGKYEKTTSTNLHQQRSSDNDDSDRNLDDQDDEGSPRVERNIEENDKLSPELVTRRIELFTPRPRPPLSKQKRGNSTSKPFQKIQRIDGNNEQARGQKVNNVFRTDEEICRKLEEDSDEMEATAVIAQKDAKSFRPLPISPSVRSKLQEKQLLIKNTGPIRRTRATSREKNSEKQRNDERQTELDEQRQKMSISHSIESKSENWENLLFSDDEDESFESKSNRKSDMRNGNRYNSTPAPMDNVNCPICNKSFPHNEIEDHAAYCEQFEASNEEDGAARGNDVDRYECTVCGDYRTVNGNEYEEHVQQCIQCRDDKMRYSCGSKDMDVDNVATHSSFRNFKPISEQKNSEIDYMDQLSSYSKTRTITSKKRKH